LQILPALMQHTGATSKMLERTECTWLCTDVHDGSLVFFLLNTCTPAFLPPVCNILLLFPTCGHTSQDYRRFPATLVLCCCKPASLYLKGLPENVRSRMSPTELHLPSHGERLERLFESE
jgi:hypothetical protein